MKKTKQLHEQCLYCGRSLIGMCQPHKRKYCSRTCGGKYKLRIKKPDVQTKLSQHEPEVFKRAMEMYWDGISSTVIARNLGIPAGTMYSWVHDFGNQRERRETVHRINERSTHNWSLKEYFRSAESAGEWLEILRSNASKNDGTLENATVNLVCGFLHGHSAGKLAAVVYEKLKTDPLGGETFAFCNKCRNAITTVSWNEPIYHIGRYIKTHGTFIWPDEKLSASIKITRGEFEHLIYLAKSRRNVAKSLISCGFYDIIKS